MSLSAPVYSKEQLLNTHLHPLPQHIAIITDGNRRWAKKQCVDIVDGYKRGGEILEEVTKAALQLGIQTLTFYLFSTENSSRPQNEINNLLVLIARSIKKKQQILLDAGIRFLAIGDLSSLDCEVRDIVQETQELTKGQSRFRLVFALNYGARNEMIRAIRHLCEEYKEGKIEREKITESFFSSYLDTAALSDPDLLIRTGGEMRLSNFLLWQLSYTELVVDSTLWPDFSSKNLLSAILEYQKRERRLGKQ